MVSTYLKSFQIGIIAGMRAMSAPALLSHQLSRAQPTPLSGSALHFLILPKTATALKVLAGGELIGDKLPSTPARVAFPQLGGRLVSGAVCGGALSEARGQKLTYGVLAGGLGAVLGSFAFYHLRRWLTHKKGLPDLPVALAEDTLTLGLGWLVVK